MKTRSFLRNHEVDLLRTLVIRVVSKMVVSKLMLAAFGRTTRRIAACSNCLLNESDMHANNPLLRTQEIALTTLPEPCSLLTPCLNRQGGLVASRAGFGGY